MKNVLKILAIVFIALHVAALAIYAGVFPADLVQGVHLPFLYGAVDFFPEESGEPAGEAETQEIQEEPAPGKEELEIEDGPDDTVWIQLADPLPKLKEDDLYDLVHALKQTGAIMAVSDGGENLTDRIRCDLTADTGDPGRFTASFYVEGEDGRSEVRPVADLRVDLDSPYLALAETEVTILAGTGFDPASNVIFCMDLDGTVLTEFVEGQGNLSVTEPGDYEIQYLIYSRVNASYTVRTTRIHVTDH